MIFSEKFLQFIEEQNAFWENKSQKTKREEILARGVKLSEETGEVCDAILGFLDDQRKDKQVEKHSDIGQELSDVIIVCAMIAKTAKIDINKALISKMKKIKERDND